MRSGSSGFGLGGWYPAFLKLSLGFWGHMKEFRAEALRNLSLSSCCRFPPQADLACRDQHWSRPFLSFYLVSLLIASTWMPRIPNTFLCA